MKELCQLLSEIPYEVLCGSIHRQITGIAIHSEQVTKGNLFFCMKGSHTDGHVYIQSALRHGAAAVIMENADTEVLDHEGAVTYIQVTDAAYALALAAHAFYDYPARKLITIGITGTKGKTTTACMLISILQENGYRAGYIGTLGTD